MKHFRVITVVFLILIGIRINGNAEFVFKKDGAIIKGTIIADESASITVKKEGGIAELIYRKNILRTIYTDIYLGKVYARLTSGEVIEGYQVDEDRDNYFFRKDITRPEEFTIPRRKVMFIARTNPTDLKGIPSTELIRMTWSPPFKPAKIYRVYIRDVKSKEEKFRVAGETAELEYTLKKLQKSWSYEIYATAIADTGEESLPSEKIVVNTLPEAPEKLNLAEKLSSDGKSVTLTFTWKNVDDPLSRVKSYSIYENEAGERKKKGSSSGSAFELKDFPAEGRHLFEVAAVNDLLTESADINAVYDAGFRIYTRIFGAYLIPTGDLKVIADPGSGGLLDVSVGKKSFSAGVETGYLSFSGIDEDMKGMTILPLLAIADYRIPLFFTFSIRPVIKCGAAYNMIEYIRHSPSGSEDFEKNAFNPMASAGVYLDAWFLGNYIVFGGAEYSSIFQNSGRTSYISYSFGAAAVF